MNITDYELLSQYGTFYEVYNGIISRGSGIDLPIRFIGSVPSRRIESVLQQLVYGKKASFNGFGEYFLTEEIDLGSLGNDVSLGDRMIGRPTVKPINPAENY